MFSEACPSDERDDEFCLVHHVVGCSQMSGWRWGEGGSRAGWAVGSDGINSTAVTGERASSQEWDKEPEPQRCQGANEPPGQSSGIGSWTLPSKDQERLWISELGSCFFFFKKLVKIFSTCSLSISSEYKTLCYLIWGINYIRSLPWKSLWLIT